jgi:hypothetical protein
MAVPTNHLFVHVRDVYLFVDGLLIDLAQVDVPVLTGSVTGTGTGMCVVLRLFVPY